jgi:hypothetical protein
MLGTGYVKSMDIEKICNIYLQHIKYSIHRAERGLSLLSPEILTLPGMSSPLVRHFLNNLCSLPKLNYLEIGCWKGSTLVSALYGNKQTLCTAIAIDNWSTCNEKPIKDIFMRAIQTYLRDYPLRFFEQECFSVDLANAFHEPINVYFYDANHNALSHKKAFTYFNSIFADVFIAVVDDWNWERVRQGTRSAFKRLNYHIAYEQEFFTSGNNPNDWWNGLYVAIVRKNYRMYV